MKKFWTIFLILFACFQFQYVQAKDIRFAQFTEMNFTLDYDDTDSEAAAKELKQAIKNINKDRNIDFVIFTGNSVRHPDKKEITAFFKLANRLHKPYYVVIGNKEVLRYRRFTKKNFMHAAWRHNGSMRFKGPNYEFKPNNDIVFLVVDGVNEMMPVPSGYYRAETLKWLDKKLQKYQNKKVVIVQHFPVFSPTDKPSYNAVDADKYIQTINSYDNVIAIISGHFNIDKTIYKKGVYHINSPAFGAPYYTYKVISIEYTPKYLHSVPTEFSLKQKLVNMVEPKDIQEEIPVETTETEINNVNNIIESQTNPLEEKQ